MTAYRKIQGEVKALSGFVPKTCWMARALEILGVKLRMAPNRIDRIARKHPCPPSKMAAIVAAIYKLERAQSLRVRRSE